MSSYVYTAGSTANVSANIQTDKVRIATTTSPIQVVSSYPNVSVTGTVTANTSSNIITGSSSVFFSQLNVGAWIGNATGVTVGIVESIANNTSLTLTANANVAISGAGATFSPFGVAYTSATANSEIIPANTTRNNYYVGQGNVVSYLNVSGATAAPFSITELGMPYPNTGTSGVNIDPANGGISQ